jgi:hypothetical protein
MADAMKPLWQNVEQEAPDELVGAERHCFRAGVKRCPPATYGVLSPARPRNQFAGSVILT